MFSVILGFIVAFLFVAGSTQIENPWLAIPQFIMGIWSAIGAAITGWQESNK